MISSPEAAGSHYNIALCFEKLATVVDPAHDRVEKGSVWTQAMQGKQLWGWELPVSAAWSTAGMTQPAQHREGSLQHWAGQRGAGSSQLSRGIPAGPGPPNQGLSHPSSPSCVPKDTGGGHLSLPALWVGCAGICVLLTIFCPTSIAPNSPELLKTSKNGKARK